MSATGPAKTCIRCGQDCSGKPRTKDPQGRYTCRECYDKALAARAQATEVKPARAAVAVPAGGPAAASERVPDPEPADGVFGLEDDAAGLGAIAAAQPKECTNCGLFLPQATIICTRCGLNTQTGKVLGTQKVAGEGRQCIKCGYSLQGLKGTKCPECGTVNFVQTKEEKRREQDRKASRAVARNAYLKPIIVFIVGLAAMVGLFTMLGASTEGALVSLLMKYAIFVPIGVVVYFICCLLWMGFDAPMHLSALRLAAAFAVTDAISLPAMLLGFLFGPIVLICAMGLILRDLMDLDIQDAIILAVILVVVQVAVVIAINQALQDAG